MAGNKKPRRKYVPRVDVKDNIGMLFDGDKPLSGDLKTKVLMSVHIAARNLAKGESSNQDLDSLAAAMNISMILCEKAGNKHIGLAAIYDASNAIINALERLIDKGTRTLYAIELNAINGGIHVFEELVETVTKRQYVAASTEEQRRLRAGQSIGVRAGKSTPRYEFRSAA